MSIAAETRDAAQRYPFLLHALRAGVVNYAAAAEFLGIDGDTDAVATALRRYADELPAIDATAVDARVTMQSGVGVDHEATDGLLSLGDAAVVADAGQQTAVLATGDVDAASLGAVCSRLAIAEVEVTAAATLGESLVVVVGRREGATAVRIVEDALANVPG